MTSYKEVVEMLGENLASLLELAKKWLVEWNMDSKKLSYILLHLSKADLIGLVDGTHEIKAKEQVPVPETKPEVPAEKFALLANLGTITVPEDYVPGTQLATFGKKNRRKFHGYNDDITDTNFPNPSRILKPGDKLNVLAFKQIASGTTTSEERIAFLATQKDVVYTGAQGATLVWDQKRDLLPKGKWYASFDEKDRLWKDSDGDHSVPCVVCYSSGAFSLGLGCFGHRWRDDVASLFFYDISA